jgi:hypothetical protein
LAEVASQWTLLDQAVQRKSANLFVQHDSDHRAVPVSNGIETQISQVMQLAGWPGR